MSYQESYDSIRGFSKRIAYFFSILLIFILPWRTLLTLSDGITAARVLGALAGFFWLTHLISRGQMRRLDPFHIFLFLFVSWFGFTSIWTVNIQSTLFTFFSILSSTMFCLVLWDLFRTEKDIETSSLAYILGCYVLIIVEGFDFIFLGHFRIGNTIAGPNGIATYLVFGLPLSWFLINSREFDYSKAQYISMAYFIIAPIAILFTRSRQGFVAMVVALFLLLALQMYSREQLQISIIGAVVSSFSVFLIAYHFFGDHFQEALPIDRLIKAFRVLTGELSPGDAGLGVRFEIYSAGIDIFRSNFLHGTGAGTFPTTVEPILGTSRTPHSTYIAIATESGIIGLLIFSVMILILLRGLMNFNQTRKMLGFSLLVIYLLVSLVNTWLTSFTALFILSIILLSSRSTINDVNRSSVEDY